MKHGSVPCLFKKEEYLHVIIFKYNVLDICDFKNILK